MAQRARARSPRSSTLEQPPELALVRREHRRRAAARQVAAGGRRGRSGRRRRAPAAARASRASSRANATRAVAAAEPGPERERAAARARRERARRRRRASSAPSSSGSARVISSSGAALARSPCSEAGHARGHVAGPGAHAARAAMQRRAGQPARAAGDEHVAARELRRGGAAPRELREHRRRDQADVGPATGAPRGNADVEHARRSPACALPGSIHRPGLAAWKVAVAVGADRGARRPRRVEASTPLGTSTLTTGAARRVRSLRSLGDRARAARPRKPVPEQRVDDAPRRPRVAPAPRARPSRTRRARRAGARGSRARRP